MKLTPLSDRVILKMVETEDSILARQRLYRVRACGAVFPDELFPEPEIVYGSP